MLGDPGAAKVANATTHADDAHAKSGRATEYYNRTRRAHLFQYVHRVFVAPDVEHFDMPYKIPQYIGKDEHQSTYSIRGYVLPEDEEATAYFGNRRLENQHPLKYHATHQTKHSSSAQLNSGSVRLCAPRSKSGACLRTTCLSTVAKIAVDRR